VQDESGFSTGGHEGKGQWAQGDCRGRPANAGRGWRCSSSCKRPAWVRVNSLVSHSGARHAKYTCRSFANSPPCPWGGASIDIVNFIGLLPGLLGGLFYSQHIGKKQSCRPARLPPDSVGRCLRGPAPCSLYSAYECCLPCRWVFRARHQTAAAVLVDASVSTGIQLTYTTRKHPRGVRLSTPSVLSLNSLMSLEVVRVLPIALSLMSPMTPRLQGVLPRRLVLSLRQPLVVLGVLRVCGTWLDWSLRFSWSLLGQ